MFPLKVGEKLLLSSLLMLVANKDRTREVRMLSQPLHWIAVSALLIGRKASNLVRQSAQ
jgi:hypothetical protein